MSLIRAILILLVCQAFALAQPITSFPQLDQDDISDPTKIFLYSVDQQSATPGLNKKMTLEQIRLPAGFIIIGTGNSAVDDPAMTAAVTAANLVDDAVIWISGTVQLVSNQTLKKNISLRGIPGTGAEIEMVGSPGPYLWWRPNGSTIDQAALTAGVSITAFGAYASNLVMPTNTVEVGDLFLVYSEDNADIIPLTEMPQDENAQPNRPMELHQCSEIRWEDGGNENVVFGDFVVDAMTAPQVIKMVPPLEGIVIEGINFTYSGATNVQYKQTLQFNVCKNLTIRDCKFVVKGSTGSPGGIDFKYCFNSVVENCRWEQADYHERQYAVVHNVVNRCVFRNSSVSGVRHAFTTGSQNINAKIFCGTRNSHVVNVHAFWKGGVATNLLAFDTHAVGWGTTFNGCTVVVTGDVPSGDPASNNGNVNFGFSSRSRATRFLNCSVDGGNDSNGGGYAQNGFQILASDCEIINCQVRHALHAVDIKVEPSSDAYTLDNCKIQNCLFEDLYGTAIEIQYGTNHDISGNVFRDCGNDGNAPLIGFYGGHGVGTRIERNSMSKYSNKGSIGGNWAFTASDIIMSGNILRGYIDTASITTTGFNKDDNPANYAALHADALKYNINDAGH